MNKNQSNELEIKWITIRIIERFMNVLFPIEIPVLLRLLPNIGYIVPSKRLKGVIDPGEALAIKGNNELILNQDNKLLGIEGSSISDILEAFNELRNFWIERINPNPAAETHYVEIAGTGFVGTTTSPSEKFIKFWSGIDRIDNLSKIVGFEITNYGLRLVTQSIEPNDPEWFDLRIQPQVISSANHYYTNIVWRTRELANAIENIQNIENIIKKIIHEIERE